MPDIARKQVGRRRSQGTAWADLGPLVLRLQAQRRQHRGLGVGQVLVQLGFEVVLA